MTTKLDLSALVAHFLLIHARIRNDDHCPICRRYYVSFHATWDAAYHSALKQMKLEYQENEKDMEALRKNSYVWIDEWVRRSNGDSYRILSIDQKLSHDAQPFVSNVSEAPGFFGLCIRIRPEDECPNNIQFRMHLAPSVSSCVTEMVKYDRDDMVETVLGPGEIKELEGQRAVWIKLSSKLCSSPTFYHLQVVPIEPDHVMELNSLCPHIQHNAWPPKHDSPTKASNVPTNAVSSMPSVDSCAIPDNKHTGFVETYIGSPFMKKKMVALFGEFPRNEATEWGLLHENLALSHYHQHVNQQNSWVGFRWEALANGPPT